MRRHISERQRFLKDVAKRLKELDDDISDYEWAYQEACLAWPKTRFEIQFIKDYEQTTSGIWRMKRAWIYQGEIYKRRRDEPLALLLWLRWWAKREGDRQFSHPTEWEWQCPLCQRWYDKAIWDCQECSIDI